MSDNLTSLVAGSPLGAPGEHGLARLARALDGAGWSSRRRTGGPEGGGPDGAALAFVAALGPSAGPEARALAARAGVSLPLAAESLAIAPLPATGSAPPTVLLAGGDERGLAYALHEAARRVELAAPAPAAGAAAVLALFPASVEAPQRRLRSLCVFPHNAELEAEWYRSLDFWAWYFDLLVLHRFNRFTLTFGHQTAYLAPPYPFFVDVPEHPEVQASGLDAAGRAANLELLRGIARMATERGLEFALGVWSQHAHTYGTPTVSGLDADNLVPYCAAGLRRMLQAVPEISAVQLRVNSESGVHLDEGARFWRALFEGVAACGRPVALDLRAKAITDDTVEAGLATGLPVTVDTKFWTEHQGLPYHATLLQEGDRYVRRHSYGDQLRYPEGGPRPYDFLFQLWNLGTNRFLLWTDPEWVRRFAAASTLGDSVGFEVCAPLSNKGFGDRGGYWPLFADSAYTHYRWEQERYWPWYAAFGRLGYSGDADPTAWGREWAARLGPAAAPHAERALQRASGVLPLLTARHSPSASVFGYWPEMDTGGLLDLYLQVPGSDVGMFASAEEAVAERLAGRPGARQTPSQSSELFERLADEAESALAAAEAAAIPADENAARELRAVALDVRVQAALARYHAAKLRAAGSLAAYYASGDLDSLLAARPDAAAALAAWESLVALTRGVYAADLIFGRKDDQDGHWADNLPYVRHDVHRLDEVEALLHRYGLFDAGFDFGAQLPPRTGTPPLPFLHDYAVERGFAAVGPQTLYTPQTGFGWGGTYGLVATAAPKMDGKTLRGSAPRPEALPQEPLYQDFVTRHPAAGYDNATFLVDLPDGEYEVTVILGDRSAAARDHGPVTVRLQSRVEAGPVDVPAGEVIDLRRRVAVTNGRLTLEVTAPPQGDWLLTGLVVRRVAPRIGHLPPPAARPGQPLDLRATVSGPEPLRSVVVRYRFDGAGPFLEAPLTAVEPAATTGAGGVARYGARIDVPAAATSLDYTLVATDDRGTATVWPDGAASGPRRLGVGAAAAPPRILHLPPAGAVPGAPLTLRARVTAGAPLERVTLHYRHLNQFQTHDRLPLSPRAQEAGADGSSGEFEATIPGEHVDAEWDLMYHLEAVDVLGNATFWPGLGAETPYVVLPVARPAAVTAAAAAAATAER